MTRNRRQQAGPSGSSATSTRIGLISDTHGLLRPEAVQALRGSDLIIHGGDIGAVEVIEGLREVAPVVAIQGNVDRASWALTGVHLECGPPWRRLQRRDDHER